MEFGVDDHAGAIGTLLDARVADSDWSPTFLVLAELGLRFGELALAREYAEQALALERAETATQLAGKERGHNRGLLQGAEMMLGWVAAREGDAKQARAHHRQSIEDARASDHMYREQFVTQSTLGLAELELRAGAADKALSLYRRAWQLAGEYTSMLGGERLVLRAQAGMAAAYAGRGEVTRAHELLEGAAHRYLGLAPQNWFWGASFAQLNLDLALAHVRSGDPVAALDALTEAVRIGWRDARWLDQDPELAPIRDHAPHATRFRGLVDELEALPAVRFEPAGRALEGLAL
jgi:tetratricopeptide (TPR) repeat protein